VTPLPVRRIKTAECHAHEQDREGLHGVVPGTRSLFGEHACDLDGGGRRGRVAPGQRRERGIGGCDGGGRVGCGAQTVAMAFLGTMLGTIAALCLAFFAAKNTMPIGIVRHAVRRVLDVFRGIDQVVWGLVFVRAVGLGPLAGVLAIFISDMGNLAKLYSEAIENIDRKQVEGVRATGADGARVIRFGYLPQILPVFISLSLYSFESSTRSATILGLVGAGGIGMIIIERFRAGLFDQVAFVVLNVLVVIAVIDWGSGIIRKRFIGERGH